MTTFFMYYNYFLYLFILTCRLQLELWFNSLIGTSCHDDIHDDSHVYFQKPRAFQLPTTRGTIPSAPVRRFTSAWCFSNSWITSVGAEREQAAPSGEILWTCMNRFDGCDRTDSTMSKVEETTSELNFWKLSEGEFQKLCPVQTVQNYQGNNKRLRWTLPKSSEG